MATPERVKPPQERQVAILERIATHAPLADTLDELVAFLEAQIPGAIGSLLLLQDDRRPPPTASAPPPPGRCPRRAAAPTISTRAGRAPSRGPGPAGAAPPPPAGSRCSWATLPPT